MKESVVPEKPGPIVHYIVDGSEQSTTVEYLTPQQILDAAGIDGNTHWLAELQAGRKIACGDRPIRIRDEMKFVSMARNAGA